MSKPLKSRTRAISHRTSRISGYLRRATSPFAPGRRVQRAQRQEQNKAAKRATGAPILLHEHLRPRLEALLVSHPSIVTEAHKPIARFEKVHRIAENFQAGLNALNDTRVDMPICKIRLVRIEQIRANLRFEPASRKRPPPSPPLQTVACGRLPGLACSQTASNPPPLSAAASHQT